MTLRRCCFACLVLLFVVQGSLSAQASEPAGAVIAGVVRDADGAPLESVTVRALVWTDDQPETVSSRDGRFRLELDADSARYATLLAISSDGQLQGYQELTRLDPSASADPVDIVLTPPRTVDVIVRNANGEPVLEADVEVSAAYTSVAHGSTDADGVWEAKIPENAPLGYVIALKDGIGFDYYQNARQFADDANADVPERIELSLDGAIQVEVLAATDGGMPVGGIVMLPWTIQIAGRAADVNISGSRIVRRTTDEAGRATFGWIPARFESAITILMQSDEWHAPTWPSLLSGAIEHRLDYRLRRKVTVSGQVLDSDGNPAAGIHVSLAGQGGNDRDDHQAIVTTDADGRYQAVVPPQLSYIVTVDDDEWASETLMNVPIYEGQPRNDLDLTLIPGTRIHGRVQAPDGTPLSGQPVTLRLQGEQTTFRADDDSNYWRAPMLHRRAVTDDQGRYEIRVGPGTYLVWGPDFRSHQEVTVGDEAGLQLDFEYAVRTRQPLTGVVVRADDESTGVPDVALSGVQIEPSDYADIAVDTDDSGRFAAERYPSRMLLHALSRDGSLGATREIQAGERDVVIAVAPTSSAVGLVMDELGQPTPGFRFRYAIEVKFPDGTTSSRFGGTAFTDDDGRFRLEHLVVNQEYECRHEEDGVYYLVTKVTAPDAETVDLGTLTYPRGQRGRTYVEWLRDAFARANEPTAAVETVANLATLDGRRVLLIEGSEDDGFVRSLFRAFDDDSRTWDREQDPLRRNLAHFILVGVPHADAGGAGRLVVLDPDRSVVAEAAANELTGESGEVDATALTQFLEAHLPEPPNTEERMAQAMEASEQSGKPILVVQVAAHDSQSERMLEFVLAIRPLLERHFILFPVADHMSRGRELTRALRESLVERYVDRRQRQVPWVAVIDASGSRLAAAEINDNTVGYPRTSEQIDVFLGTLRAGAPGIGDAEMKELREALAPGP